MNHADAMLERDRLAKLAQWERFQQEQANENHNPKITAYAATIQHELSAPDRLYQQSFEAEEKKAARLREKLSSTGPSAFSPRITAHAESVTRNRPVEDDLMDRYISGLAAKQEAIHAEQQRSKLNHTPAINPVSDVIATRLQQSTKERLLTTKQKVVYRDPEEEPTFAPATNNPASRSSSTDSDAFKEMLRKDEEKRREKIERLREERERKEMADCTFTPRTHHVRGQSPSASQTPLGVWERSSQWVKRRSLRVEDERRQKAEEEVAGCTFQPAIAPRKDPNAGSGVQIYGGDGRPWGVSEYLARQDEARRIAKQREERLKTPVDRWRNAPTVVEEFQLGRRENNVPIRALERPASGVTPNPSAWEDMMVNDGDAPPPQPSSSLLKEQTKLSTAVPLQQHLFSDLHSTTPGARNASLAPVSNLREAPQQQPAAPAAAASAPIVPISILSLRSLPQQREAFAQELLSGAANGGIY